MEGDSARTGQGFAFGPFRLFAAERLLEKQGEPVQLGGRALDILIALVDRAGDVVTKDDLLARVWGGVTVDESSLRVHIAALRRTLGDGSSGIRYIVNVPGRGYCFVAPVSRGREPKAAEPAAPHRDAKPHQAARIPARLARMVGREELIEDLRRQAADQRLITIHGPGGIGKTTVAIALGHALMTSFDGAVHFVDLGLLSEPALVPGSLASVLGLQVQSSDTASAVVNFLRDRRALLILDSCEHVIDPVASLAERLFQEAPQLGIIATSREPLRIEGEHVYRLPPLQSPPDDVGLTAQEALTFPAANLLIERSIAGNHQFKLEDADAPLVGEICRKLDGIALAIELAAGRISTHGLRETAALLDRRMKLLWRGRRTASPRHQTMTAALDWSYDLLPELEQVVLRRLSVFVGTFTLDAARAVVSDGRQLEESDVIDALDQLAFKSLVSTANVTGSAVRYRLLDTTRAYARAKLDDLGETSAVARRHTLYWQQRLEESHANKAIVGLKGTDDVAAEDLGNVRAALDYMFSNSGDPVLATRLTAASVPLFTKLSLLSECFQKTGQALALLGGENGDARLEMKLQAAFGHSMMFTRGNSDRALAALKRGLELAENLEDRFYEFRLLSDLHMFRLRTGRYRDTLALAERALAVAGEISDPVGLSAAHRLLSTSYHLTGNQAEALAHLESWQPQPSQVLDTSAFNAARTPRIGMGRVLWLLGFPERALQAVRRADEEAINVQSPVPVCIVTIWGAHVLGWTGDWDAVDKRADRLIAYAHKHSLDPHIAVGRGMKGAVLIKRGAIDRGIELLQSSLIALRADRYELYAPNLCVALAEGLSQSGRIGEAMNAVDETIAIANANGGLSLDMAELFRIKGALLLQAQNRSGAEEHFEQALAVAEEQSALSLQLRAAISFARLKMQQGDPVEAGRRLAVIYGKFEEGFDTADLKAAKTMLDEIGAA